VEEPVPRAALIDDQEERRLASLRADLIKQATGTPSQGVAARLALEQFEYHLRKKQSQKASSDDRCEGSENFESTPFNVAMAKKRSPLKKVPARILVAAPPPPPPTLRKVSNESIKPAQRIISTAAAASKTKATRPEERDADDVFRSRPIDKAKPSTAKMTSSISKSMNAREKLLGPSSAAANRAKANVRINTMAGGAKRTALKVDIGKENIPPGSELSTIAVAANPQPHMENRPKSRPVEVVPSCVDAATSEKICDGLDDDVVEDVVEDVAAAVKEPDAAVDEAVQSRKESVASASITGSQSAPPPEETAAGSSGEDEPKAPASAATNEGQGQEALPASALHDWSKVSESLPGDTPLSASKSSSSMRSVGPFMSTPIRRPLGALQDNRPQSSPILSSGKTMVPAKAPQALLAAPPIHAIILAEPLQHHDEQEPTREAPRARKALLLAPIRKM
jgi:hypothetical protein